MFSILATSVAHLGEVVTAISSHSDISSSRRQSVAPRASYSIIRQTSTWDYGHRVHRGHNRGKARQPRTPQGPSCTDRRSRRTSSTLPPAWDLVPLAFWAERPPCIPYIPQR